MIRRRTRATRTAVERHYFLVAASFGVLDDRSPNVFIFHLKLPRVREGLFRLRRGEIIGRCRPSAVEPKWKEEAAAAQRPGDQRYRATLPLPPSFCLKKRACHLRSRRHLSSYSSSSFCQGGQTAPRACAFLTPRSGGPQLFCRPTDRTKK